MRIVNKSDITFDDVASFHALMDAAESCKRGVRWKSSTQMFEAKQLQWCASLSESLYAGTFRPMGFTAFDLQERGKKRHIQAVRIPERVVQKSLVRNALRPAVEPRLIYDNSASIKGKGTEFALNRLKQHLSTHYRKHGRAGGILVMDYKSYFDSISHAIMLEKFRSVLTDDRVFALCELFINAFDGDHGLGLGSEISQTGAIFYPNDIDHMILERLHAPAYARYMDDSYLISDDLGYLKECRDIIAEEAAKINLHMNTDRTQIIPFRKSSFQYLKKRVMLTDSGKVVMRLTRQNISHMRRRLRKLADKYDSGEVAYDSVWQTYQSWRGYAEKYDTYQTVQRFDQYFSELFGGVKNA